MKDKDSQLIFEAYLNEGSIANQFAKQVDLIAAQIERGRVDEFDVRDFLKFKPHIRNWEKLISAVEEENHPLSDGASDLWNEIQFIGDDVAYMDHAWDEHYLGHDLDAIQELVGFLKSEFEEGTHYKLHIERGDDLPNTVSIHKKFQAPVELERKLAELLDGASGPPEGEEEDESGWF
jgi:hypothetical protein